MSSALYQATIEEKAGSILRVRVTAVHPAVEEFGTDKGFAWQILSGWISPAGDESDAELAARHIQRVEHTPIEGGTVTQKNREFFSFARTSDEKPSVVYTLEVSAPSLIADIDIGAIEKDGYYEITTPEVASKIRAFEKKRTTKPKPAKAAPSLPSHTFEDVRSLMFRTARGQLLYSYERITILLHHWAADVDDAELLRWLDELTDAVSRPRSYFAGKLAFYRARAGQMDSARWWLEIAEKALPEGHDFSVRESPLDLDGLIPSWWMLGKDDKARAGFELRKKMSSSNHEKHLLFSLAAMARQTSIAEELFPGLFPNGACDVSWLVDGLLALLSDGGGDLFDRVMTKWSGLTTLVDSTFSTEALRMFVRAGTPERYIALSEKYKVVDKAYVVNALAACEARDAKLAVTAANQVLDAPDCFRWRETFLALAILATHAPEQAQLRGAPLVERPNVYRYVYLAALGRNDEARAGLCADNCAEIASVTTDRALAVDALKMGVELELPRNQFDKRYYARLVALGERAYVDATLERALVQIAALKPGARTCAGVFAEVAARVGRRDLAQKAITLPTKSYRNQVARYTATGCAASGDWTGAFAALMYDSGGGTDSSNSLQVIFESDRDAAPWSGSFPLRVAASRS